MNTEGLMEVSPSCEGILHTCNQVTVPTFFQDNFDLFFIVCYDWKIAHYSSRFS